ncbi:unnamed protein product [Closterium sp. NIES-65]|nr:unnamed protein product [Closterium sp. NIES-65]
MSWLDTRMEELHPALCEHVLLHKRYIDDGVVVWTGSLADLHRWIEGYNNLLEGISITTEISTTTFTLLDITFRKGTLWETTGKENVQGGFLDTSVYQKPLNAYQYFPFRSAHPRHCKRGFIIGELYRYLLRESSEDGFQQMKSRFAARLQARGYHATFIDKVFSEVTYADRATLLQKSEKGKQKDSRVLPFVLEYHPSLEHPALSDPIRIHEYQYHRVL